MWRAFQRVLSQKEQASSLALFRMAIGICIVFHLWSLLSNDVVTALWVDRDYGGIRPFHRLPWLIALVGEANPTVIYTLCYGCIASSIAMIIGFGGRWTVLLVLQLWLTLANINNHASGSYDFLASNALWLLFLSGSTKTLAVDCWIKTRRWVCTDVVAAWPRYLLIYQLVLMYTCTGLQKVASAWHYAGDWSAIYYILQQPTWQRFSMEWVADWYLLTQIATMFTWFFEVGSPLLLLYFWLRHSKPQKGRVRNLLLKSNFRLIFFLFGLGMHIVIAVLMAIGPFSILSLSYYLCLWHPDEYRYFLKRRKRESTA